MSGVSNQLRLETLRHLKKLAPPPSWCCVNYPTSKAKTPEFVFHTTHTFPLSSPDPQRCAHRPRCPPLEMNGVTTWVSRINLHHCLYGAILEKDPPPLRQCPHAFPHHLPPLRVAVWHPVLVILHASGRSPACVDACVPCFVLCSDGLYPLPCPLPSSSGQRRIGARPSSNNFRTRISSRRSSNQLFLFGTCQQTLRVW